MAWNHIVSTETIYIIDSKWYNRREAAYYLATNEGDSVDPQYDCADCIWNTVISPTSFSSPKTRLPRLTPFPRVVLTSLICLDAVTTLHCRHKNLPSSPVPPHVALMFFPPNQSALSLSFSLPLIVAHSPFGEIQEKVLTDTSRRKSWGKVHKANNYLPLIIHLINIVRLSH